MTDQIRHFYHRAEIGLRAPNEAHLSRRAPDELAHSLGHTEHWTGLGGNLFHPDPLVRLRGIQAFHMDTRGYGDIAYNAAYDADGNTYELRAAQWVSAHAQSDNNIANRFTDGVVFLEDARGWTHLAGVALAWWADLFAFVHGRHPHLFTHAWWKGHGGIATDCPGPYIANVVGYLQGSR